MTSPRVGTPVCQGEYQPAQRVGFLLPILGEHGEAACFLEFLNVRAGLDQPGSIRFLQPLITVFSVVFVLDVADNLFHKVLDRHQPVDTSELIYDQCHVNPFALHLLKQCCNAH